MDICAIYINLAVCFKSSRLSGAFPLVDAFGTCYIISKLTEQLITAPGPLKVLAGFEASSLEVKLESVFLYSKNTYVRRTTIVSR